MANLSNNNLVAQSYSHNKNKVGGHGIAGTRHDGGSQDAFWPSKGVKLPPVEVVDQLGQLYVLSDGMTKCADGHEASQLAVQTVAEQYYAESEQPPTHDLTAATRLTRLQKAVWQAHLRLCAWDEKFYCKCKDKEAALQQTQPTPKDGVCPQCDHKLVGLQATLLAAVIHERHLFLVAVGDSEAKRIPGDSNQPITWLHRPQKGKFLGSPTLSYRQAHYLPYREWELKAGDLIVLYSDGVAETLQAWKGESEWGAYLRQQLTGQDIDISKAVPDLINSLHNYRTKRSDDWFNDDLTMLAVALSENAKRSKRAKRSKKKNKKRPQEPKAQPKPSVSTTNHADKESDATSLGDVTQPTDSNTSNNKRNIAHSSEEVARSLKLRPIHGPKTARTIEIEWLSWLSKIYQDLITQLEQKNWLAAIALADDNLLYQELRDPSLDTIRNGILLLRSYEELAAQESEIAQNSLARIHKEFSLLLRNKFGLEIEAFDAQNPPTIDQLLERLISELKGRTPIFASDKMSFARRSQTQDTANRIGSVKNNDHDSNKLITRLLDPSSVSREPAPLHPPQDQVDAQATTNLVRQAARLAFQEHKLAEAIEIMTEAAQNESTDKYMAKKDWKALWTDPAHRFQLRPDRSFVSRTLRNVYALEQLVELLEIAKEIDQLFALAISWHPSDNRIEEATTCWEKLHKFYKNRIFNEDLPAEIGADRLVVAKKLAKARLQVSRKNWKQALKTKWNQPASKHLRSAQAAYAAVVWRSFLGLESGVPQPEVAARLLKRIEWLNDQYGWALALEEAQELKEQGKVIEAACTAVGMQIPKNLHSSERNRLVEWERAFVYEAWELALGLASGKYSKMDPSFFESAINALQDANLSKIPGSYASRMRAVEKLLPVAQHANDVVSAALAAQQIRKHRALSEQENQQLLRIRQQRIDQVWQVAQKRAADPQSIRQEQRDDLHKAGDQLLGAQETVLVAAGMLFAAALYFQADKRAEAAEAILEAWQMVEGHQAKKQQVWQLAEQIYLQPWEKVRFWQVGRQRQLKQMRDLADQYGFRQVNSELTRTLDRQTDRARNELMAVVVAIALFLLMGVVAVLILGANADTPRGSSILTSSVASQPSPTSEVAALVPEPTHSPTPLPPTEAISVVLPATPTVQIGTSTALPSTVFVPTTTPTAVPPTSTEPPAKPILSPWEPQAGPPLAVPPMLIEMTLTQVGVGTLYDLIRYFGHSENAQVFKELSVIEALTDNYPGGTILRPDIPLRGMLPADPLFLFVGQIGETQISSDDQKLGFELQFGNSGENIPNVLVNVPYTDAQDRDNKQQGLEIWRRDDRNWAWVLGSSQPLTDVLLACRDSLVKNGANGYDCPDQVAFVTGEKQVNLKAVVLRRIENGQLAEFLLGNAGFENRWIYADLAKNGLQLMLPQDARNVIAEPGLGLVRASLQPNGLLVPSHILQRRKNDPKKGIYTRIGP